MPLEIYQRGPTWWVRGRIEYKGTAISEYYRCSTGASSEAGARDWIAQEEDRAIRRHLLGDEAELLTFADAVLLYPAKTAEAKYLIPITEQLGSTPVARITPQQVRDLGPKLYPGCATDTWRRQVISPVSAVINNAHDLGRCPPIRIKGYSAQERIDQDKARGKQSRAEKTAGSWEWLLAFQTKAGPYLSALAEFMFETGARISQAVALRPKDLDLQRARVMMPASKGHHAQWVAISMQMVVRLANLPARKPHDRATDTRYPPRVFGYQTRTGPIKAWKHACEEAGIPYLSPHAAGRHGFYTELRVRQGVDSHTAAKAGRWAGPALPDRVYGHSETDERAVRDLIRTGRVHAQPMKSAKSLKKKP
jgi:integrase